MRTFLSTLTVLGLLLAAALVPAAARADLSGASIAVSLSDGSVWGGGFEATTPVSVTLLAAPGGAELASASATTDGDGWFELAAGALATPPAPGMQVVVAASGSTRELTLAALTFDLLDPGGGVASGTAPPGADVVVDTWPGDVQSELVATARADGSWRADFAAAGLPVGGNAAAQIHDDDGDATWVDRQAPQLKAVYHYEFSRRDVGIGGSGFTPGGTIDLEILAAPGGAVLWSGSTLAWTGGGDESQPAGGFDYCCTRDMLALGFDLAPGMQLRAVDTATSIAKELTLAPFTIDEVDPATNSVSGTAEPAVRVWLSLSDAAYGGGDFFAEAIADAAGAWHVAVDPADFAVTWRAWVEAGTNDADQDWTGAEAQPRTIAANLTTNRISGMQFSLGSDVAVEVLAGTGGPLLWSTTVATGETRAFDVEAGVPLEPGLVVRVTDEASGVVKEVTLVPLTIDVLDPVADRAAGTAAPGATARIWIWWAGEGGGEAGDVFAGATGAWSFDFAAVGADVTASSSAGVYVADAEADTTNAELAAPTEAIPALEQQVTELVPAADAKPLLAKLDAALASLGGSTTATALRTTSSAAGGHENVRAAISQLGAFVNQVHALVRSHRLDRDVGVQLAGAATRIAVGLGG